jgi:5'-3' exonuclease
MGIPKFFGTLVKRYPNIIQKNILEVDILYIDFNAIIHQESNKLKEELKETLKIISTEEFEQQLINNTIEYTKYLQKLIKPKELTYIGFDGTNIPRGKIENQKRRRYMSQYLKEEKLRLMEEINAIEIEWYKNEWDSNNISVGTLFMIEMAKQLKEKIKDKIIISDTEEPKEGEHKIFEHLMCSSHLMCSAHLASLGSPDGSLISINRLESDPSDKLSEIRKTIVINGMDADLILLALNNADITNNRIYLMRSEDEYIDIDILKNNIKDISTFIFLMSIVGNDFLPHLTYMSLSDNRTLDKIFELSNKYRVILKDRKIDWKEYIKVMEELGTNEDKQMEHMVNRYNNRKEQEKNIKNMDDIDRYMKRQVNTKVELFNGIDNWRTTYYDKLFEQEGENTIEIKNRVCKNYIDGLIFYVNYYFKTKQIDNGYYYKYKYSPSIQDIQMYIEINEIKEIENKLKDEYTISQLLFYIMPYSSKEIVIKQNKEMKRLYEMDKLGVYVPKKYGINKIMRDYIYNCEPEIPKLNIERILKE